MSRQIGIDLGTTNSCVAVMENGEAVIIPSDSGTNTTPSVVAFTQDAQRLVGETAKRQAVTNPERTISSVKRSMGSEKRYRIDKKLYSPEEISAMILSKLKNDAQNYLGDTVSDAVITVPAYFTDAQRQATKDAGKIAGLNVLRIVNEPTAAALAYGLDKQGNSKVMVYDLGGGTFDVSILSISNGFFEVLATAGNNKLGGDDFDLAVSDYILSEFYKKEHIDLKKDPTAMQRVREAAEKAKIELSSLNTVQITLPFIAADKNGPKNLDMTLTREKFEALTCHLIEATRAPVEQTLKDSGMQYSDLDRIILVGGSTRIPAVAQFIKKLSGIEPFKGINPDECVAIGAALQSGVLSGQMTGLLLLDVTPLSLGIETTGDCFSKIIERNTSIPIKKSQIFTTAAPYQSTVEVHVLQGERERASKNKTLGKFRLSGIRRAPAGVPQIEVTFDIDANGIVNVSAHDIDTGKSQDITITASGNLSQEEIDRAVNDAKAYAQEDGRIRLEREIRARADMLIRRADMIKDNGKEAKSALKEEIKKTKKTLKSNNVNDINKACDDLERLILQFERP